MYGSITDGRMKDILEIQRNFQYYLIHKMADQLEEARVALFVNPEHIKFVDDQFEHFDQTMFHIQSELRNLYREMSLHDI